MDHPDQARIDAESAAYTKNVEALLAARTQQLRQSLEQLERSYDIALEALGNTLGLKNPETLHHSNRVTAFTIAIAHAMQLPRDQLDVLARGAFLHDIGKLSVDDSILRKPSALTPDETVQMHQHCVRGYELVRTISFLADCAEIVYAHHENFDGSGYPRGLKGDAISLGARIVAVANALDAITSDQPYRPGQSLSEARAEIERSSGRQFDPAVVRVFLSMPEHIWADLRAQVKSSKAKAPTPVPSVPADVSVSGAGVSESSVRPSPFGQPGTPVPAVDPVDLKAVWTCSQEVQARYPGGMVATGEAIYRRICSPDADVRAVTYRCGILSRLHLMMEPILAGSQPSDGAFKVAARMELKWMTVGVPQSSLGFDVDAFFAQVRAES